MSMGKTTIVTYACIIALTLAGARGCNMIWNNQEIIAPSHHSVSYVTGISGHVEYTRFVDGSQEFKEYPGWGHKLFDSELNQDIDGDGLVDRIRRNGSEMKMNSLTEILIRKNDYDAHRERFDAADEQLQELAEQYN